MALFFYLTTNVNRNEPENVRSSVYVHVKAKSDGSQTIIISEDPIMGAGVQNKTQAQAQAILDGWITEENLTPGIDANGNLMIQDRIDLDRYLDG